MPRTSILFVLPRIPTPIIDGGTMVMVNTLIGLQGAGVDVHVVALNTSMQPGNAEELKRIAASVTVVEVDTAIHVIPLLRSFIVPPRLLPDVLSNVRSSYWVERFARHAVLEKVRQVAAKVLPSIVHCESLFTACYGMALQRFSPEIGMVLRSHNVESNVQRSMSVEPSRPYHERLYRGRLAEQTARYEQLVVKQCDVVCAIQQAEERDFKALGAKHTTTITPGVPISSYTAPTVPHSVCLFGSLHWAPNVAGVEWFLSKVWPLILHNNPDATCHVAGANPPHSLYRLFHGCKGIVIDGQVEDAVSYRKQFAVNVVPVFSGAGVRIKLLEALAVGNPVVTTTMGAFGLPLVAGKHAFVADSPETFAESVLQALTNSDHVREVGLCGQRFVQEKFSWQSATQSLLDAYRVASMQRELRGSSAVS
jgi:polysaccharide biosynthesis protein PslH